MNDFLELETELKRLRPAPIGDQLFRRIERALLQPEAAPTAGVIPRRQSRTGTWWSLGLGLTAATVLILLGLGFFAPPRQQPTSPTVAQDTPATATSPSLTSGLQASALTQTVYTRRDEGLVFSPNQSERLLRRVRYETRETMQWRNPQTGASLRVSYPAEQVVLTPVSFQ
jgi:hypothetical protein